MIDLQILQGIFYQKIYTYDSIEGPHTYIQIFML